MSRHLKIAVLATAMLAVPGLAAAHCGSVQGSFTVTCEQGVKVYRHNAPSMIPQGLSQAQARVEAERIRAKTARAQIAAQSRAQSARNDLERRRIAVEDYRARVYARNTRNSVGVIGGFGNSFRIAQPLRVRSGH